MRVTEPLEPKHSWSPSGPVMHLPFPPFAAPALEAAVTPSATSAPVATRTPRTRLGRDDLLKSSSRVFSRPHRCSLTRPRAQARAGARSSIDLDLGPVEAVIGRGDARPPTLSGSPLSRPRDPRALAANHNRKVRPAGSRTGRPRNCGIARHGDSRRDDVATRRAWPGLVWDTRRRR